MENQTKKCKYCKADIPTGAIICKFCNKKQYLSLGKIIGIIIICVIAFSIVMSIISVANHPEITSTELNIGDIGYLTSSTGTVMLGTTKDNVDQLTKLSVAKDTDGITQMVLNGQAILADSGTQVRIIDVGMFVKQVRLLDGKYSGQSGWLPDEFLSKTGK